MRTCGGGCADRSYWYEPVQRDEAEDDDDLAQEQRTVLPDSGCFSACAYAFMGGSDRRVLKDGALGVHQFYGRSGEIDEGSSQAVVSRHLLDVASVTLVSPSLPSAFARPAAYGDSGGDRPCSHRDLGAFLPRNLVNRACMAAERMGHCRPRLRPGLAREAVLCAWGIDEEGKKVLLALSPGTREDTECCRASSRTCGGAASSTLTWCAGRVRDDQPTPARSPAR